MADEESKLFSLREAERLRLQLEPTLIEAIESRRKLGDLEEKLGQLAERIQRSGGLMVHYEDAAKLRIERNRVEETIREALERIHSTGCIVKDLEVGLLDFPRGSTAKKSTSAGNWAKTAFASTTVRMRALLAESPSIRVTPITTAPCSSSPLG